MSRLTKKFDNGLGHKDCFFGCSSCTGHPCEELQEMIEKLAHYEDLEEQGRLIELPCLPIEKVWVGKEKGNMHKVTYISLSGIVSDMEDGFHIVRDKEVQKVVDELMEPEAKLAELKGK